MLLDYLLIMLAVVASLYLVIQAKSRLVPLIAAVASGLQALAVYGVLRVESDVVSLGLVFGAAIAISGCVVWFQEKKRLAVTAATTLILAGGLQLWLGF